jgi:hypothetical protein
MMITRTCMYMYAVRKAVGKEDLSGECSMASFGTWAAVHARLQRTGRQAILFANIEVR